ncbi:hypothetical protein HDIA_P0024 (plasmid) [Hartmannibacter diazotrophicus]|uniref:Sel1 repeat n=1 Tax=Hartmannibacter diazotrophicus TaxID=1482074 RepID=A0A2C9DDV7_9HYPH|nr:sel1 repeat family protein [Hartmannibacter diazotrophicus]SON58433.1 hypothetical protein HDIA_P0024 [Hartmannibacter diazotrophicus]
MTENRYYSHNELLQKEPDLAKLRHAHEKLRYSKDEAISELKDLASSGSILALNYLGDTYRRGDNTDYQEAAKWYRLAFEGGSINAIYHLGTLLLKMNYLKEAKEILEIGVKINDPPCYYWLARTYEELYPSGDRSGEIEKLLLSASKLGNATASTKLGLLYARGRYGLKKIPVGIYMYFTALLRGLRTLTKDRNDRRLW